MRMLIIAFALALSGCAANAQNVAQQNNEAAAKQAINKMQSACNGQWALAKKHAQTYVSAFLNCMDIQHQYGLDANGQLPDRNVGISVRIFHRADTGQISLDQARHELASKLVSIYTSNNQKPTNDACANWGFQPGTPQYGNCKLRLLSILMRPAPSTTCTFVGNQMNCQ